MNPYKAELLAKELINEFLPYRGWNFQFDNAKRRFGQCRFSKRTISLSKPLTIANDEAQVRDTILHEIAHALAGASAGHGPIWKNMCAFVGANPQRCYTSNEVSSVQAPYALYCPTCDVVVEERFRRTNTSWLHKNCRTGLEWVEYG